MKKLTITTSCKPPTATDEDALGKLLVGVNACYTALMLDLEYVEVSGGLGSILTGSERKKIAIEVKECNRMVAFITFREMGLWAEINFCEGKSVVKKLTISFVLANRQFLIIAK